MAAMQGSSGTAERLHLDLHGMQSMKDMRLGVPFGAGNWGPSRSPNDLSINAASVPNTPFESPVLPSTGDQASGAHVAPGFGAPVLPMANGTELPGDAHAAIAMRLALADGSGVSSQPPSRGNVVGLVGGRPDAPAVNYVAEGLHPPAVPGSGALPLSPRSSPLVTRADSIAIEAPSQRTAIAFPGGPPGSALSLPGGSPGGVLSLPGGSQGNAMPLHGAAPSAANNGIAPSGLAIQFSAPPAPSVSPDTADHLPRISSLLQDLVPKAVDAQTQLNGGNYETCSELLAGIKTLIQTVGDLGVESLAATMEYQQAREHSNLTSPTAGDAPTTELGKSLLSAAAFAAVSSTNARKRAMPPEGAGSAPAKSLRGSDATSMVPTQPVFDFQIPHPAVHPEQAPVGERSASSSMGTSGSGAFAFADGGAQARLPRPDAVRDASSLHAASMPTSPTRVPSCSVSGTTPSRLRVVDDPQAPEKHAGRPRTLSASQALHMAMDSSFSGSGGGDSWTGTPAPNDSPNPSYFTAPMDTSGMDVGVAHHQGNMMSGPDASGDDLWDGMALCDRICAGVELEPEVRRMLDEVFHAYLNKLCSNLDATDDRGELIHQTLMPKKMARLDESPDFRPFKFRIQAFTNAFQSELTRCGIGDDECSIKRIKHYLWTQPCISRFNEDGKKAKSKGNHIWSVEAKKLPEGGWAFRTFAPKITGASSKIARVGEPWTWNLRIWDPQASSNSIKVVYSANTLPAWIHWEDNEKVLTGVPSNTTQSGEVSVTALYVHLGQLHRLEHAFFLQVLPSGSAGDSMPLSAGVTVLGPIVDQPPNALPGDTGAPPPVSLQTSPGDASGGMLHMGLSAPPSVQPTGATGRESVKHEVVEPSQAPGILSSIPFPFTPPVYMADKRAPHLGMEQTLMACSSEAPPAANTNSGSGTHPGSNPTFAVHNAMYNGATAGGIPQPSPMAQTSVFIGQEQLVKQPADASADPVLTGDAAQMWDLIESRQRENVASLMLSIPTRRQSFSRNEHPGQGTPMTNLPGDMSATLPSINDGNHP
ncbi:hypothetical protein MSPP1_002404 [Malassezia sp. CBS 17886]|nr:hypothetical protein MSPP1_002404 [Malassezia sp. CBS 17886]